MTEEQPWPGPIEDPLDPETWGPVHQRHYIGMGLVADMSTQIESIARWILGMAVGIVDGKLVEALFLGDRMSTLRTRIVAVAEVEPRSNLKSAAAAWAKIAANVIEKRDALLHRPVLEDMLLPARRSQMEEELSNQAEKLFHEMEQVHSAGEDIAFALVNRKEWVAKLRAHVEGTSDGE